VFPDPGVAVIEAMDVAALGLATWLPEAVLKTVSSLEAGTPDGDQLPAVFHVALFRPTQVFVAIVRSF
jgi:hypothetical protein